MNGLRHLIAASNKGDGVHSFLLPRIQQMADLDRDEPDGLDRSVIRMMPTCFTKRGVYIGARTFCDDEMNVYVNQLKRKLGPKGIIFISMDACHSGDGIRAEENDSIDADLVKYERGTDCVFSPNIHKIKNLPMNMISRNKIISGGADIDVCGACKPNERNFEHIDTSTGIRRFNGSLLLHGSLIAKSGNAGLGDYFKTSDMRAASIFPLQQPYYEDIGRCSDLKVLYLMKQFSLVFYYYSYCSILHLYQTRIWTVWSPRIVDIECGYRPPRKYSQICFYACRQRILQGSIIDHRQCCKNRT